jgi:hypothetical protein
VLRYDTVSEDCFSINLSTDGGESWAETYELCTGQELDENIGAVVVGNFLYVAYIMKTAVHSARVMRYRSSDGERDPIYGSQIVFNAGVGDTIRNLDLCSNADSFDDRLYMLALNSGELRFFWTDEDGGAGSESWNELPTGVSDAWWTLEASANENSGVGSGYHPMALYMAENWDLMLWRFSGGGPVTTLVDPAAYGESDSSPVSISAFDDFVVISYWNQLYEIRTCVSADGGDTFDCDVHQGDGNGFVGAVNARQGAGIAEMVVYDGDPPCLFRYRDYTGSWSGQVMCSDLDVSTGAFISLESLPPHSSSSHGAVVLSSDPDTGSAYFISSPVVFADGFESGDDSAW